MPLDVVADALRLAPGESLTLYWLKVAALIMSIYLCVVQHLDAPHLVVAALELHLLQLLFHFLLNAVELSLLALHRTHAGVVVKLLQTLVVVAVLALFALHRINQDSLAQAA